MRLADAVERYDESITYFFSQKKRVVFFLTFSVNGVVLRAIRLSVGGVVDPWVFMNACRKHFMDSSFRLVLHFNLIALNPHFVGRQATWYIYPAFSPLQFEI